MILSDPIPIPPAAAGAWWHRSRDMPSGCQAELPTSGIGAEYIYNGILVPFELGHKFCRQILDFVYLLLVAEWQEGVKETDQSCGMIAEYLLEREVCLRI